MRTAVIRVGEPPAAGSPYPVELFTDGGNPNWLDQPIASASMPADMADPNPPTDSGSRPLAVADIVPYLLREPNATDTFLAIGKYLHRQVLPDGVGDAWRALRAEQGTPAGTGLRTYLDIRPASLRRLPWELGADPSGIHSFISSDNPWA